MSESENKIQSGDDDSNSPAADARKRNKNVFDESECHSKPPKVLKTSDPQLKIAESILNTTVLEKLRNTWSPDNVEPLNETNIELCKNPFKICVLQNFLDNSDNIIGGIAEEMANCEWTRKQMDLYEFNQITIDRDDFVKPNLRSFYQFLLNDVKPWMETVSGFDLKSVSASCSMYNSGDYLLVHDDLLSNRKIAFVFYLSPWIGAENWTENMGGALELFTTDEHNLPIFPVVKKIYPQNNQFVFFHVSDKSFHQVGEVMSLNYPRLTINGWFHVEEKAPPHPDYPSKSAEYLSPHTNDTIISEWINDCYLHRKIKQQIQNHIEQSSEISLEEFLIPEFFEAVQSELKSNPDLTWTIAGPANEKYYEILKLENITGPIKDLLQLCSSREFFKLLFEFTELDLHGESANQPKCNVAIQRWRPGCYTILGDTAEFAESSLDAIMYFNSIDNIGVMTYLTPNDGPEETDRDSIASSVYFDEENDHEDESDSVLLTVYPRNNVLNLVYRSDGTARFTKYVSKSVTSFDAFVYILVCNYKE